MCTARNNNKKIQIRLASAAPQLLRQLLKPSKGILTLSHSSCSRLLPRQQAAAFYWLLFFHLHYSDLLRRFVSSKIKIGALISCESAYVSPLAAAFAHRNSLFLKLDRRPSSAELMKAATKRPIPRSQWLAPTHSRCGSSAAVHYDLCCFAAFFSNFFISFFFWLLAFNKTLASSRKWPFCVLN